MSDEGTLSRSTRWFWQAVALCSILLSLIAAFSVWQGLSALRVDFLRSKWLLLYVGFALAVVLSIWLLVALRRRRPVRFVAWVEGFRGSNLVGKLAALLTIPAGLELFFLAQKVVFKSHLPLGGMLWVFWLLALASGLALKAGFGGSSNCMLALPILAQGVLFKMLSFLPGLSRYPFSLGWSEASRYYYASLPFAARLYGQALPLSFLHPTRYLLQAIPFLIPGTPLWADRLWQVILWVGMTAFTTLLLVWRLKPGRLLLAGLVAMWFFLYLFQGAVYYHLQICIWIVLLGVAPRHPWRSLSAVLLASVWAGMSRVNWFPVPAMLAAGLYFLEVPLSSQARPRGWFRYLLQPALWFVTGLAVAFASQAFYVYWSGNSGNAAAFASSFTSSLLWYRLWPNPTFAPGVVLGITLVSLPVLAIIGQYAATKGRALHPVRWLVLAGMLGLLFAGGLVVSVKIGGGGDLHNMDAFLTLVGLVAAYFFTDRIAAEADGQVLFEPHYALTLFAMLVPVAFAIYSYHPMRNPDLAAANQRISLIRAFARKTTQNGGEVLFVSQRQLLTFGYIRDVPLVPDYELLTLMEMALSDNQDYLNRFYSDLDHHRFAMIIAPAPNSASGFADQFSDEDNVWAKRIGAYLYCEYRPIQHLPGSNLEILVPRRGNPSCP